MVLAAVMVVVVVVVVVVEVAVAAAVVVGREIEEGLSFLVLLLKKASRPAFMRTYDGIL